MTTTVEENKELVTGAASWEIYIIVAHPLFYSIAAWTAVSHTGPVWTWKAIVGFIWGVTLGIGMARSLVRRLKR